MPSVSGSKTVNNDVSPVHPAATLTTIFGTAVESLTIAQFNFLAAALQRRAGGEDPNKTIGSLFS